MRILEVGLVVMTLGVGGVRFFWRHRTGRVVGAAVLAATLVAHLLWEGPRWQMTGVYLVVALMIVWRLLGLARSRIDGRRRWPVVLGLTVVGLSALLSWSLPVPRLPEPTGPLAIATTSWALTDQSRDDPYDGEEGRPRRLVAQAWYPTDTPGPPAPLVSDPETFAAAVAPRVGLPSFALRHLNLVDTTATLDAPIKDGTWPVVVYSHGWRGFRTVQSDLAESLASNGYIVVALDHTYGASVALFPDGDAVRLNSAALPEEQQVGPVAYQRASAVLEATYAADVAFLLDQLAAGQGPSQLGTDLQADRVGLVGHSTGGGAMIRLCLTDDRCAAMLGFDPWVEPVPSDLLQQGLSQPLLSIRSAAWQGNDNDAVLTALHGRSPASEGLVVVPDTLHGDFTLLPFLTPLSGLLGLSGDTDTAAMHRAVDTVALDFFDRHLDGQDIDQVTLPAPLRRDG